MLILWIEQRLASNEGLFKAYEGQLLWPLPYVILSVIGISLSYLNSWELSVVYL